MREPYEKYYKRAEEIRARMYLQDTLRMLKESYSLEVEDYLGKIYSVKPFDLQELEKLLDNVLDRDSKMRIMNRVRRILPLPRFGGHLLYKCVS